MGRGLQMGRQWFLCSIFVRFYGVPPHILHCGLKGTDGDAEPSQQYMQEPSGDLSPRAGPYPEKSYRSSEARLRFFGMFFALGGGLYSPPGDESLPRRPASRKSPRRPQREPQGGTPKKRLSKYLEEAPAVPRRGRFVAIRRTAEKPQNHYFPRRRHNIWGKDA